MMVAVSGDVYKRFLALQKRYQEAASSANDMAKKMGAVDMPPIRSKAFILSIRQLAAALSCGAL